MDLVAAAPGAATSRPRRRRPVGMFGPVRGVATDEAIVDVARGSGGVALGDDSRAHWSGASYRAAVAIVVVDSAEGARGGRDAPHASREGVRGVGLVGPVEGTEGGPEAGPPWHGPHRVGRHEHHGRSRSPRVASAGTSTGFAPGERVAEHPERVSCARTLRSRPGGWRAGRGAARGRTGSRRPPDACWGARRRPRPRPWTRCRSPPSARRRHRRRGRPSRRSVWLGG